MPSGRNTALVLTALSLLASGTTLARSAPARPDTTYPAAQAAARNSATVHVNAPLAGIEVQPASITLDGAGATQHLLITAVRSDGSRVDVTGDAAITLAPPGAAEIKAGGVLSSLKDGAATLTARWSGLSARIPVLVRRAAKARPVSFENDLVPLLTKIGCNAGACHGAAAGKNGFRLSLRGFDPAFDYEQIVKDSNGRRVDLKNPARSLVFQKPSGLIPHGGGLRLPAGSPEQKLLLRWLQEGRQPPDFKVSLVGLDVFPEEQVLPRVGVQQHLLVLAHYSDGATRDVTTMARYSSNDEGVASVTDDGLVNATGSGDTAVMVAYGGLVKAPRFIVPVGSTPVLPEELPACNAIDAAVYAKLAQLRIHPSPLCTDAEFLRRATLDITGVLPTEAEVRAFRLDTRPDKRARLVDSLLARPEYTDFRALKLADLLRVNGLYISDEGAETYYRWIHRQVAENVPWDRFVRELIVSHGPAYHNGPANYYRIAGDTSQMAETTAQTFLGIRMQCARCHNHPFERWTQNDYYSFAAYFARVRRKGGPEFGEEQVFTADDGDVNHPKTNAVMPPRPLGGPAPVLSPEEDRRVALADWLTAPTNTGFAREAVNRVWADFFGKGIVDPVDDVRVSNPPSNEKLLDLLATEFVKHDWDTKWLIRFITSSRTYQLSSAPTPTNATDTRHFARALPRRLSAEQAVDAINNVTGGTDRYGNLPPGTRAAQLPDGRMGNYFLQVLGKPKREILCACERDMQPNLSQSLHFINSGEINYKVADWNGWLHKELRAGVLDTDIVDHLYLRSLGRYPTWKELHAALQHLCGTDQGPEPPTTPAPAKNGAASIPQPVGASPASSTETKPAAPVKVKPPARVTAAARDSALEDMAWAVLNSREFLFNH